MDSAIKTPFYAKHREYGAKIVPFAGYLMPIQYRGILEEHRAVRNAVGVFDVSHMGEFSITGPQAAAFLNRLTLNDVSALAVGQVQYSAMCYPDGGIVDDLLVYRFQDHYLLVVNAANIEKDWNWLQEHRDAGVELKNVSSATALLAVQGPDSFAVLQELTQIPLHNIPFYHFTTGQLAGSEMTISRTGYTGERGFELYHDPRASRRLWEAIFEAGRDYQIQPVGLGARDTLRMEMKYCLYGNDIDQSTNPLEAGLGWITKLDKGDFIGRAALLAIKNAGVTRRLVAFEMSDRGIPRPGYRIFAAAQEVGRVTSGTQSPSLNIGIGLGYVRTEFSRVGTELAIEIRGNRQKATVIKPPFVEARTT